MKNFNLDKASITLGKASQRLKPVFVQLVDAKQIKMLPTVKVIRKELSIGGKQVLLESDSKLKYGVNDFDGNKLDEHTNLIVGGIGIQYDKDAASSKEADLTYGKALPAALRNATLVITQGGVIAQYPFSVLSNQSIANSINGNDNMYELPEPFVITDQQRFEIEIQYPQGAAIAGSDKHYLELTMFVFETSRTSA